MITPTRIYSMLSCDAEIKIAKIELSCLELRLFLLLSGSTAKDGYARLSRQEIAEELNANPASISKAMKTLTMHGIVSKEGNGKYRISDDIQFKTVPKIASFKKSYPRPFKTKT